MVTPHRGRRPHPSCHRPLRPRPLACRGPGAPGREAGSTRRPLPPSPRISPSRRRDDALAPRRRWAGSRSESPGRVQGRYRRDASAPLLRSEVLDAAVPALGGITAILCRPPFPAGSRGPASPRGTMPEPAAGPAPGRRDAAPPPPRSILRGSRMASPRRTRARGRPPAPLPAAVSVPRARLRTRPDPPPRTPSPGVAERPPRARGVGPFAPVRPVTPPYAPGPGLTVGSATARIRPGDARLRPAATDRAIVDVRPVAVSFAAGRRGSGRSAATRIARAVAGAVPGSRFPATHGRHPHLRPVLLHHVRRPGWTALPGPERSPPRSGAPGWRRGRPLPAPAGHSAPSRETGCVSPAAADPRRDETRTALVSRRRPGHPPRPPPARARAGPPPPRPSPSRPGPWRPPPRARSGCRGPAAPDRAG